jgi:hypothetical protein
MKVQYVGMFNAVDLKEVADPRGFAVRVARGEAVEVPDEVGERLCEQADNWKRAAEPRTKAGANTEANTPSEG